MLISVKCHWIAICFAILLGIMTGLPQIIAIERLGERFHGIYPTNNDDESYYLARGQDVLDGHDTVAQPYLFEGKDRLPLQFWFPDYAIAKVSSFFYMPLHRMFTSMDFLLPAVIYLLTYAIGLAISDSRTISLSGASILHFAIYFVLFNRPISPQFNFIFLLGFLLTMFVWERSTTKKQIIVSGLLFGSLFHVYAYYWTYATVFLALYCVLLLTRREFERLKQMIGIILIGTVVSIPYFIQLYLSFGYEFYAQTVRRVGMIGTHTPSGVYIIVLALSFLILLVVMLRKGWISWGSRSWLVASMVIAVPIAANQHIITGQNLEFSSHYRTIATFAFIFGLQYFLPPILERMKIRWRGILLAIGSGTLVGWSLVAAGSIAYAQSFMRADEVGDQRYGETIAWLREHSETDDVVFANERLSELVPAYTQDNVFYAREANLHYMSDREVQRRVLVADYFSSTTTRERLLGEERSVWGTYYINRYAHEGQMNELRRFLGLKETTIERYPEDEIPGLIEEGNELKRLSFRDVLAPYRVDYIVWDTETDPEWDATHKVSGLVLVHEDAEHGILIYEFANL